MKQYILIALTIFSSIMLRSQNYSSSLGFKINPGISYTNRTNSSNVNFTSIPILNAGIEFKKSILSSNLYLETGLYFLTRGYKTSNINFSDSEGNLISTDKLFFKKDYISVPLGLSFRRNHLIFGLGPELSYVLRNRIYDNGKNYSKNDYIRTFAFGYQANIGWESKISNSLIFSTNTYFSKLANDRSFNFGLGVGIKFYWEKKD